MDEILHHLRDPGRMIAGFQVVQDFVHPQYDETGRLELHDSSAHGAWQLLDGRASDHSCCQRVAGQGEMSPCLIFLVD